METFQLDRFSEQTPGLFGWIYRKLMDRGDEYVHLGDLESYIEAQQRAVRTYADPPTWAKKAVLNVARMGKFSSDRTIREYAKEIWGIQAI